MSFSNFLWVVAAIGGTYFVMTHCSKKRLR